MSEQLTKRKKLIKDLLPIAAFVAPIVVTFAVLVPLEYQPVHSQIMSITPFAGLWAMIMTLDKMT